MATSKLRPLDQRAKQLAQAYAAHRPLIQRGLTVGFVVYVLMAAYRSLAARPITRREKEKDVADRKDGKPARVAVRFSRLFLDYSLILFGKVDAIFYQRLGVILRIVIPSMHSKEALLLFMHSSLLIFRTAISLYVAALDGKYVFQTNQHVFRVIYDPHRIVASLVRGQSLQFLLNIIRWLLVAIPATWTNSWLSYVQNKLALAYRTRLTKEVLGMYLGDEADGPEGKVYYKLC